LKTSLNPVEDRINREQEKIQNQLPNKTAMETQVNKAKKSGETLKRSLVKTITYRTIIIILDFIAVYLFTKKIGIAAGFTIVSNIYTSLGYFLFERVWSRIKWGRLQYPNEPIK
jgi:adenylylsulfate kinase